MIRTLTLAATAITLVAAPALAANVVRVSAVGKTTAQLHADITVAARKVCRRAASGATFFHEEMDRCVKQTITETVAKSGDPALVAAVNLELAQR